MKIKDKMLLGIVCGLVANVPKVAIGRIGIKMKVAEIDGPEIAAGIFIPPHKLTDVKGKIVGYIADSVIAGFLGVATVYGLAATGKNQAPLKGLLTGQVMWMSVYGLLGSMGLSKVKAYSPKTVLTEFFSHSVFGWLTATLATKLGDENLFNGNTPMLANPISPEKPQTEGDT